MKNKLIFIFVSLVLAVLICGTSAAAVNETTTLAEEDVCVADPIINGTININEYGNVRPLEGVTVIVNSSNRILATATTDADGYYTMAFYSNQTVFNVTASYMGCNPVTQSVTVTPGIIPDPNYYGTSNFTLTPKNATVISTGSGTSVYIKYSGQYSFAGVINVRVDGVTYRAFCIDLYTPISIGDYLLVNGPLPGTAGDLSPDIDWAKVNYIINNYNPSTNLEAAAMQSAIWYFTSAHYGTYPGNNPNGYYQFMTYNSSYGNPYDGYTSSNINYSRHTVANRAWQIINAAQEMQYPYQVTLTPETTRVPNGSPVTLNAQVTDFDGNPLSGIGVNFTTNRGTLSSSFGFTDLNGMVSTVLSGLSTSTAMVTASVNGTYGTLLYDDVNNRKQNMVALNVLPYTMSDTSIINHDVTAQAQLTQQVTSPVNVGDSVTYTVNVTNNGPNTATGIMIENQIPQDLGNATVQLSTGTYYQGIWVIPSLAQGESATLTITGTATVDMAGKNTTNTATRIAQDQYNSEGVSVSAAAYTKMADIQLSQTGNTPVNVGDEVTYVVTAQNIGPDNATNFIIENKIPAGLLNVVVTPSTGSYLNGNWTVPFLANGDFATLTITGISSADMAGKNTTNTATKIFETEYDPTTIGESVTFDVYTKKANVVLSQTGNYVKDLVTFLVKATNNGPDAATNLNIKNLVPAGLTNVLVTPNLGTYDVSTGIWNIPVLANGAVAVLNITGNAIPKSTTLNNATILNQVEYNSQISKNNHGSIYLPEADVRVSLYTSTGKYTNWDVNNVVTWVADLINLGPDDAHDVVATILLPVGLEFSGVDTRSNGYYEYDPLGRIITWYVDFMPSGGAASLNFFTLINKSGDLTVTLNKVNQAEFDPNTTNNVRSRTLPIPQQVDVQVTQTVNNTSPGLGENITYTVQIRNNGPGSATGLTIKNLLPSGLTFVSADTGAVGTYDPITGIWNIGNFNNGQIATLTINAVVDSLNMIKNTAKLETVDQFDWNFNNNAQNIIINQGNYTKTADVRVSLYTSTGKYTNWDVNNVVTWVADLINLGPDDAHDVVATILLPVGLEFSGVDTRSNGYYEYDPLGRIITWYVDFMPSGGAASLNFFTLINKSGDLTVTLNKVNQAEFDPNTTNNVRSRTLPIPQQVNLVIDQDINGSLISDAAIGEEITININIENQGDNASGLTIKNSLPEGLTFVSADTSGVGTYDPITGIWNIGTFNSNEKATLSINVIVNSNAKNTIINTAKLEAVDEFDWNFNDNSKKAYLKIIERES